jgi:CTP synthase
MNKFRLKNSSDAQKNYQKWEKMAENIKRINNKQKTLKVAMVVKYFFKEAYISVIEALKSAGFAHDEKIELVWIDAEKLEQNNQEAWDKLRACGGIVVTGGFGKRGIEGKILAARYARQNLIPYLGLCLGSQIMAIEFAREILKDPRANSEEFDAKAKNKVVHFVKGQRSLKEKGGTMRLGDWQCHLVKGTKTYEAYQTGKIVERHRHRYEFNNKYEKIFAKNGFIRSGYSPETNLTEIVEIKGHPFMIGSQFHPEFKSRPTKPHPLFLKFIETIVRMAP